MTIGLLILGALALTVAAAMWCALAVGSADDDREGRDG